MAEQNNAEHSDDVVNSFRHGLCYHTSKAIDLLKTGKPGDMITRKEMAKAIDRDCATNTKGYGNVNTAIRRVEREFHIVWRWSRADRAWKCLGSADSVNEAKRHSESARKQARRSLTVSAAVKVSELTTEQRLAHNVNVAVAGAVVLFAGKRGRDRLLEAESIHTPTYGDLEKLFHSEQKNESE